VLVGLAGLVARVDGSTDDGFNIMALLVRIIHERRHGVVEPAQGGTCIMLCTVLDAV
jgi:hypothetical protein